MTLTQVDEIPEKTKGLYTQELEKFISLGCKYAETDIGVQPDAISTGAAMMFLNCIRRDNLPVKVHLRGKRIFLERTDLP